MPRVRWLPVPVQAREREHSLREAALLQVQEPAAAVQTALARSRRPAAVRMRCCSTSSAVALRQPAMGSTIQSSSLEARPHQALPVGTLAAVPAPTGLTRQLYQGLSSARPGTAPRKQSSRRLYRWLRPEAPGSRRHKRRRSEAPSRP